MSFTSSKSGRKKHRSATLKSRAVATRKSLPVEPEGFIESSGNVFLDIGFPEPEARSLLLRTDLMIEIERIIDRRKLSQTQAAKLFGVTQPRMSDLSRGKIERFSVDTLIEMLQRAGAKVDVTVRAA